MSFELEPKGTSRVLSFELELETPVLRFESYTKALCKAPERRLKLKTFSGFGFGTGEFRQKSGGDERRSFEN